MALYVGLDVSLKTTSICVVGGDGSTLWEGKAESEPTAIFKALIRWREELRLRVSKHVRYQNGSMAA
jgi:transposase